MGGTFERIKADAFKIRLIKASLAALALGLLSSGVLLLLQSFEIIGQDLLLPIGVGVISFVLAGAGCYLLLHLSDKAVAARLDKELGLEERVGTMLQYKEHTSAIHELQRNDANEALSRANVRAIGIDTLWIFIVSAVIGAMVFVSSFIFKPIPEPPPPVEETPFSLTELQAAAIEEVIAYVEASDMASPYRENIADTVRGLLDELKEADTVTKMETALTMATDLILTETDASSAALELIEDIWNVGTDPMKRLAELLNYYAWPKADEEDKFESQLKLFRTALIHADSISENPDTDKMCKDTALLLVKSSASILTALATADMPNDDTLYTVLVRLATADENRADGTHVWGFSTLGEKAENLGYTDTQRELDQAFAMLKGAIAEALAAHRENTSTGEYAVRRICEILDCETPRFERPVMRDTAEGGQIGSGDGESGGVGGGIGSGTVFGSDDLVLDPDTNTYVEYGTILDKYYALMFDKLQDGDYTEDEKAAMEKYFAILYGGFDNKEKS